MNESRCQQDTLINGDDLLPQVYMELKRIASAKLRREYSRHSLQTTGLVHEAYARLQDGGGSPRYWGSRSHFFSAAAEAMRRILVDHARRRLSEKRGGDWNRIQDPDAIKNLAANNDDTRILAVHAALERLQEIRPRQATLVKLRFFAGLTLEEAAEAMEISVPTAKRDWAASKVWIYRDLRDD